MRNDKVRIEGVIVVEGKDDITAVKRAVNAHVIALNGFSGMNSKTIEKLVELSKRNELILLTDPDFAGKRIREKIKEKIPHIKHAFISREDALKNKNIGVENASDESIINALLHVISENQRTMNKRDYIFTMEDLAAKGLSNGKNSRRRRILLGDILKIGYYNSKQLLNILNSFNISKQDFDKGIEEIDRKENL